MIKIQIILKVNGEEYDGEIELNANSFFTDTNVIEKDILLVLNSTEKEVSQTLRFLPSAVIPTTTIVISLLALLMVMRFAEKRAFREPSIAS